MINAYFDGSCWPNPGGKAAYGFWVEEINGEKGHDLTEGFGLIGEGPSLSNNVAEYEGLRQTLLWLLKTNLQNKEITVYGDNLIVIKQMREEMRAKKGLYLPFYKETIKLKPLFKSINFYWIPRENNYRADELSKRVYLPSEREWMDQRFFQTVRLPQETKPTVPPPTTEKEGDLFTQDPAQVIK